MRNLIVAGLVAAATGGCVETRRSVIQFVSFGDDKPKAAPQYLDATFDDKTGVSPRLAVRLRLVATGLPLITDIQVVPAAPGAPQQLVGLTKEGQGMLVNWQTAAAVKAEPLFKVAVRTDSEEGLLGLAFHPDFVRNRRFFLNYTPTSKAATRIAEWTWPVGGTPKEVQTLLEVDQPYQNHNAGQLAFGPDGMLYVGFGDGGWMDDPEGHGQDLTTVLGSMLRIDVDGRTAGKPYGIPADNPFLKHKRALPETWAYGLRNPWRYAFAPDGRMVVADVGQNAEEELLILRAGDNAGWDIMEGRRCHEPKDGCKRAGLKLPFLTYGRGEGQSITGGYVATGEAAAPLKDKYVFGDFASGRLWAVTLPAQDETEVGPKERFALGSFGVNVSTFGRTAAGDILVGSFDRGSIYAIESVAAKK